jgi:hypothetical protein
LPQVDSEEEVMDKVLTVDVGAPFMRKPNKMADRKHKTVVDGSPIEKVEDMQSPMDMAPSVDLFQQLMLPIDNASNEASRLFNMKYTKFDENPQGEDSNPK